MRLGFALIAVAIVAGAGPSNAFAGAVAIVVGSNGSPSPSLEELKYADDDAIQTARALALLGVETQLLVTPDGETRQDWAGRLGAAMPATRSALATAFVAARARLAQFRAAGDRTTLYLVISAHADLYDGRPFIQLEDGRLWRDDITRFLAETTADERHVVIDACFAYAFVGSRGPGGQVVLAPAPFMESSWPAHTGFLVSRTRDGRSHEWEVLRAGIFSHEVRSGILGPADANLDGKITYRELAAFVERANQAVDYPRFHPDVLAKAPGPDLDDIFIALPSGGSWFESDGADLGRAYVESDRGIRIADLHPAPGQRVRMILPVDLGPLYLQLPPQPSKRQSRVEFRIDPGSKPVLLSTLSPVAPAGRTRGPIDDAFRLLFAKDFGAADVSAYRPMPFVLETDGDPVPGPRARPRWPAWAAFGVGVAALTAAVLFQVSARSLANDAGDETGLERSARADSIAFRNRASVGLAAVGGVATAVGGGYLLWRTQF